MATSVYFPQSKPLLFGFVSSPLVGTHAIIMASTNTSSSSVPNNPQPEKQFASIVPRDDRLQLEPTISTNHHDMADVSYVVTGDMDEVYNRFSTRRKHVITAVLSFCSFLAPVSSTTVLSAVPEVAATFQTDGSIINLSNAMYMLFMGLSPCFYGPFCNIYGRKWVRKTQYIYYHNLTPANYVICL